MSTLPIIHPSVAFPPIYSAVQSARLLHRFFRWHLQDDYIFPPHSRAPHLRRVQAKEREEKQRFFFKLMHIDINTCIFYTERVSKRRETKARRRKKKKKKKKETGSKIEYALENSREGKLIKSMLYIHVWVSMQTLKPSLKYVYAGISSVSKCIKVSQISTTCMVYAYK